MSLFKQKFNPISGQLNLVSKIQVASFKDAVASQANLPLSGNTQGDARITNDTQNLYVWSKDALTGILSDWANQGNFIDLDWSLISSKPTSSVANIDDAVSLRHAAHSDDQDLSGKVDKVSGKSLVADTEISKIHTQNSDTKLAEGTANEVTAAQAKAGYSHSQVAHAPSDAVSLATVKADTDIDNAIDNAHAPHSDDQIIPDQLSDLSDDTTHRLVTDEEKSTWNDITTVALNVMLNAFRIAQIGSLTIFSMVKGFMDEYEDESGIDTVNSLNETYNSSDDYYQPYGTDPSYGSSVFTDGTESASSSYLTFTPDKAFDYSVLTTYWAANGACPQWLKYDLGSGVTKTIQKISITARGGNSPGDFTFQGSNDNSDWSTLLTVTGLIASDYVSVPEEGDYAGVLSWTFSNSTAYRYYRLYVTRIADSNPQGPQIMRLDGMELIPSVISNMTLLSNAQVASIIPVSSRIVLFEEDVDSITINTDLKAYISRNNGTTYSQVILADEGNYITGARILSGVVTISGQPSGSNIKYKIETLNNKNLKLHGVGISWK